MTCRVIGRKRSHVRTIAFIFSGKLITEALNIHFELHCNDISCPRGVVFSVMACPGILASVRQFLLQAELLPDKSPILVESLEFSDKIGQQISVWINEPIQLIPMRGRMYARRAAVLDPIYKLFEGHLIPEL